MSLRPCLVAAVLVPLAAVLPVAAARPAAALGPREETTVTVAGAAGVPTTGVGAVVLNVTATDVESDSFVTVWPTGTPRPLASNLNLQRDDTVANLVLVPLGTGGKVSIYQQGGPSEVVVDVSGWFADGAAMRAVTPTRVVDTRAAGGSGPIGAGGRLVVPVAGLGGVPATGAGAVVVNLTATGATAPTFLTAWSGAGDRPLASNLNPVPGRTSANLAVVPLAADGSITVANHVGRVDAVVDVLGWLPAGAPGVTVGVPERVLDTRTTRPVTAGAQVAVPVPAAAAGATALLVDLTLTEATAATYLGVAGTVTSAVNTVPGRTSANLAVLTLGAGGAPAVLTNFAGSVHVVVDVVGWFDGAAGFSTVPPARLLDTRVGRALPVAAGWIASWVNDHHDYPAVDIFASCGAPAVSPVTGVIVHVRRDDLYVRSADNPARRGGRSLAVKGDDGVRYYMSHVASIDAGVAVGQRVVAGQRLAVVGESGDAGACHIHFGLSPDCPRQEWSVRRGVIWPQPYLDAWKAGRSRSPAAEIAAWSAAHPTACADAAADPFAPDAG